MKKFICILVSVVIFTTMVMMPASAQPIKTGETYGFYVFNCEKVNPDPDDVYELFVDATLESIYRAIYLDEENVKVKISFQYDMAIDELQRKLVETVKTHPEIGYVNLEYNINDPKELATLAQNYHAVNSYKTIPFGKILNNTEIYSEWSGNNITFYDGMKRVRMTINSGYWDCSEYCRYVFPEQLIQEAERIRKSSDTQSEQARQALKYVVENLNYDYEHFTEAKWNVFSSSPLVCLQEKLAICQGYSETFNSLCFLLDIPCIICEANCIEENGVDNGHAYNQVFVNESWKNVNPTWDDPKSDDDSWFRKHFSEDEVDQEIIDRTRMFLTEELASEELPKRSLAREMTFKVLEKIEKLKVEGVPKREKTQILVGGEGYSTSCEVEKASSWAKETIQKEIMGRDVPAELFDVDFTRPITRQEMCYLAYQRLMWDSGKGGLYDFYNEKFELEKLPAIKFSDASNDRLEILTKLGVLGGFPDGTFKPNDTLTRAQLATIICNLGMVVNDEFKTRMPSSSSYFNDTKGHWAEKEIAAVAALGFMKGIGGNLFDPDSPLTIEQAIVTLERTVNRL